MKSFLKRKALQHLLCITLAIIITAGFIPMSASAYSAYSDAYTYRINTLGQKKTVTQKTTTEFYYDDSTNTLFSTFYMYKINVPANGYLRIASSASSKEIRIYKSINKNKDIYSQDYIISLCGSRAYYKILPRGYYYIQADQGTKFSWSFNRNKTINYCRARASSLKAGAKTRIFFTYGYECDRWFKVSLTRNKTITVTFNQLDPDPNWIQSEFAVYDSRGYIVNCPALPKTKTSYRTGTLRKGTYYIRVRKYNSQGESNKYTGRIVQIMWR